MKRDNTYLLGNTHALGRAPNVSSFKDGHVPWNKGSKGLHLSPSSEFKPGVISPRRMEVGSITVRHRNRDERYRRWIKIGEPNVWEEFAKYVWKKEFGCILRGDVVHHMNGDTLVDCIDNLIAIPRGDHPKIHNKHWLKPLSVAEIIVYKARYVA